MKGVAQETFSVGNTEKKLSNSKRFFKHVKIL